MILETGYLKNFDAGKMLGFYLILCALSGDSFFMIHVVNNSDAGYYTFD